MASKKPWISENAPWPSVSSRLADPEELPGPAARPAIEITHVKLEQS
jgi:hypothetical protein